MCSRIADAGSGYYLIHSCLKFWRRNYFRTSQTTESGEVPDCKLKWQESEGHKSCCKELTLQSCKYLPQLVLIFYWQLQWHSPGCRRRFYHCHAVWTLLPWNLRRLFCGIIQLVYNLRSLVILAKLCTIRLSKSAPVAAQLFFLFNTPATRRETCKSVFTKECTIISFYYYLFWWIIRHCAFLFSKLLTIGCVEEYCIPLSLDKYDVPWAWTSTLSVWLWAGIVVCVEL